ncbi:MAG: hypothetical protein H7Y38_04540 [Armatimonadetes bacterium]|nr:hypothetical protein [Armatimonadota bacterium]
MKRMHSLIPVALTLLVLGSCSVAAHARVTDAAGDFISSYDAANPRNGDLDVLSADVFYDGTNYTLTTTLSGLVGTTTDAGGVANVLYVWGFDRGGATNSPANFAAIGITNVFFNSVVILRPNGTVTVNRLGGGGTTNLPAGTAVINGNTISATISGTELPSTQAGFTGEQYTWNLWPRLTGGGTENIADFAPNNANAPVTVVPEAGSIALFLPALLGAVAVAILTRKGA